ncbi:ATP-grasp domain-containing protein [Hafnia alvei]|uniref:ATP-grasp domain-containing protein n=1 Tax=Hafnia alvei TaxID=569 RepID=UPI0006214AF0|nr:ATP-grasp domain-containing protein [Hafnia alvei]KKI44302.1 hypothetical protein XK86_11765 [Hafnia alvei]
MNVLIFPAGTEIGREIWSSLRWCKDVTLFLAGANYDNHAQFYDYEYAYLPMVEQEGWIAELSDFIKSNKIDFIYPAHDDVLLALVENRKEFSAAVIAPSVETCRITRSKRSTYLALADLISVPNVYSESKIPSWPVFVKPDRGQGAQGAVRVDSYQDLEHVLRITPDAIICEYLPGDEFTVDCFSDRKRGLLFSQARQRGRIRSGIAMSSSTVSIKNIQAIAECIGNRLRLYGAWFFQMKYSADGVLTLLEVAPRVAGTMSLNRVRGVNFPLLSLYESLNQHFDISTHFGEVSVSRGLSNRYKYDLEYNNIYVDFDDTLYLRGMVCLPLITLLYQCRNEGKRIYLITRHRGDIHHLLLQLRLNVIFDEIIHLTNGERKSDFISADKSIFIDDSFSERKEVASALGIPTFDNSMIELLLKE